MCALDGSRRAQTVLSTFVWASCAPIAELSQAYRVPVCSKGLLDIFRKALVKSWSKCSKDHEAKKRAAYRAACKKLLGVGHPSRAVVE